MLIFFYLFAIINEVKQKNKVYTLEEYRFHYEDSKVGESDKYFMAKDLSEAKDMFEYACTKRHLHPESTVIEKWNRWSSRWESANN